MSGGMRSAPFPEGYCSPDFLTALKVAAMLDHIRADPVGPPSYSGRLVARPAAVSVARRGVALVLRTWHLAHLIDDAQVVVSELATNAVTHTKSSVIGLCIARPVLDTVRITVTDQEMDHPPAPGCPSDEDEGGRGMMLVDAMAERWGIEHHGAGKAVWCELAAGCR